MKPAPLFAGALLLIATAALAHQNVKNPAVKARMDAMSAIGDHMKVLGAMAKGQVAFDVDAARGAAAGIAAQASRVPALFEAPESDPKSEALPAIWDNYADFTAKAENMGNAARAFANSIGTEADLRAAMQSLGATCAACHKPYRISR